MTSLKEPAAEFDDSEMTTEMTTAVTFSPDTTRGPPINSDTPAASSRPLGLDKEGSSRVDITTGQATTRIKSVTEVDADEQHGDAFYFSIHVR